MKKPHIGFIGQGFIGKNYANDLENRGYSVVRYALEEPYNKNKELIKECDVVFIAVPTPTTPDGFDDSIVAQSMTLVGKGRIAVIKSTIPPGTTERLQASQPDIIVLNSPEFLSEATAAYDAANPAQNIIGIPHNTKEYHEAAMRVLEILPNAPMELVCKSVEAEIYKYTHNINGYIQVVQFNMLYDLAQKFGADWNIIKKAIEADPLIVNTYTNPIHKTGRGAGGNCFIKDFATFAKFYEKHTSDKAGVSVLKALEEKNNELLINSKKDLHLLSGVYGDEYIEKRKK